MRCALAVGVWLAVSCAAAGKAPDWSAVTAELARRVEVDQALRREVMSAAALTPELLERLKQVDTENTAWMKTVVSAHGWPTVALVGEEGADNAWLLVQHADHDVDFQEECLALLRTAVEDGQAEPKNLAYLEDRVAMHRGRPQRYGTQFVEENGELVPYQLENPERVDEWREEIGLESLAEYAQVLKGR